MADLLLTPDLRRITVTLATEERDALRVLAFQERRGLLPTSGDFRPTEVQDAIAH